MNEREGVRARGQRDSQREREIGRGREGEKEMDPGMMLLYLSW